MDGLKIHERNHNQPMETMGNVLNNNNYNANGKISNDKCASGWKNAKTDLIQHYICIGVDVRRTANDTPSLNTMHKKLCASSYSQIIRPPIKDIRRERCELCEVKNKDKKNK